MVGPLFALLSAAAPNPPKIAVPDLSLVGIDTEKGAFFSEHFTGSCRSTGCRRSARSRSRRCWGWSGKSNRWGAATRMAQDVLSREEPVDRAVGPIQKPLEPPEREVV